MLLEGNPNMKEAIHVAEIRWERLGGMYEASLTIQLHSFWVPLIRRTICLAFHFNIPFSLLGKCPQTPIWRLILCSVKHPQFIGENSLRIRNITVVEFYPPCCIKGAYYWNLLRRSPVTNFLVLCTKKEKLIAEEIWYIFKWKQNKEKKYPVYSIAIRCSHLN